MILVPFIWAGVEGGEGRWKCKASNGQQSGGKVCTALLHRSQTQRLYRSYVTPLLNLLSHLSELGQGQSLFSVLSQHSDRLKAFVIEVSENTEEGKEKIFFFFFFLKL